MNVARSAAATALAKLAASPVLPPPGAAMANSLPARRQTLLNSDSRVSAMNAVCCSSTETNREEEASGMAQ
jgi:hypothetical protein